MCVGLAGRALPYLCCCFLTSEITANLIPTKIMGEKKEDAAEVKKERDETRKSEWNVIVLFPSFLYLASGFLFKWSRM